MPSATLTPGKAKVYGSITPRIFTPPLPHHCGADGEILPEFTDGPACIAFAKTILHIELLPWQEWFLNHALELTDDGMLRFRIIICMVARQNGKTAVENVLALWHMFCLESGMVIGTAQDLARSEEAWKDCLALAELQDDLNEMIEERNFGHPKYFNLDNGCEYRVAAASRRGARGFTGDLILLDELREHHSFDSWSSVTNTMNARPFAQAYAFSNAGDALSVVLRYQRALAHRELGWPDGDDDAALLSSDSVLFEGMDIALLPDGWDEITTGFFEWSAPPNARNTDVHAIAQANPAMHYPRGTMEVTLRALLGQLRSTPPAEFNQEVMCRFTPGGSGGPFPVGYWEATEKDEATPGEDADIVVCVEVSQRRDIAYVARAGCYIDEKGRNIAVVGIAEEFIGTASIPQYLEDTRKTYKTLVVRNEAGSPNLNLLEDLKDVEIEIGWDDEKGIYLDGDEDDDLFDGELPIVEWSGTDVQAAHADIFDRVRDRLIEHLPHRALDTAATSAEVILQPGGGFRCDIKNSPTDIASLYAVIGAVWGLSHMYDEVSMYASEAPLVIQRKGF